jgi:hypothetical protein
MLSLNYLAMPSNRFRSFVCCSSIWIVGYVLFSKVIPCLSAVHGISVSSFGMPSPPSLLPQYISPFGVHIGR